MHVICTQENLKKGIITVGKIISGSLTLPILGTVMLKTESGQLRLSTTNLEISIDTFIRCKTESTGSVCVSARVFSDLVGSLSGENVVLKLSGTELLVETDSASAKIRTLSSEEFPVGANPEGGEVIQVTASVLKTALDGVNFAVSASEVQPEISGVYVRLENDQLFFVATDRYRLAECSVKLEKKYSSRQAIVPHRTALEVARLAGGNPEEVVSLVLTETQSMFSLGATRVASRLIDGQYPDYKEIIPENFNTKIFLAKNTLEKALRTVSVFSETSYSVRFSYNSKITLSAKSENLGQGQVGLGAKFEGAEGSVVLNWRYINEALNIMPAGDVELRIVNDVSPIVLVSPSMPEYLYLIMPIKT